MSQRTTLRPYSVITNGDMAADITSLATILQSITGVTYAVTWTGTSPVGTLAVEGSNDYSLNQDGSVHNSGTWIPLYVSINGGVPAASIAISGNTGEGLIEIERTNVYALRLFYDAGSGVGTINAVINGKVA